MPYRHGGTVGHALKTEGRRRKAIEAERLRQERLEQERLERLAQEARHGVSLVPDSVDGGVSIVPDSDDGAVSLAPTNAEL